MAKSTKTKAPKAAPPVEDEELEELAEDEAPAAKAKKGSDEVEFGVADLCKLAKEKLDKDYSTRDMRTLLRKMAREDTARVNREVIPGNRARYNWPGGPKNPEVKAILKAIAGGEIEEGRKAALAKLKADKAAKDAAEGGKAKGKGKKGGKKGKSAPAETEEVEEVDFEDED